MLGQGQGGAGSALSWATGFESQPRHFWDSGHGLTRVCSPVNRGDPGVILWFRDRRDLELCSLSSEPGMQPLPCLCAWHGVVVSRWVKSQALRAA